MKVACFQIGFEKKCNGSIALGRAVISVVGLIRMFVLDAGPINVHITFIISSNVKQSIIPNVKSVEYRR